MECSNLCLMYPVWYSQTHYEETMCEDLKTSLSTPFIWDCHPRLSWAAYFSIKVWIALWSNKILLKLQFWSLKLNIIYLPFPAFCIFMLNPILQLSLFVSFFFLDNWFLIFFLLLQFKCAPNSVSLPQDNSGWWAPVLSAWRGGYRL